MPSPQVANFDPSNNSKELHLNLDLVEERRGLAAIQMQDTSNWWLSIKKHPSAQLNLGDLVLRKNEASRACPKGKLEPIWEGPYKLSSLRGLGAHKLAHLDRMPVPQTWYISNVQWYYV